MRATGTRRRRAILRVLLMSTYHNGELEAQRRAGVREVADKVGRIIGPTIPAPAAAFLAQRSFVIVSTLCAGRVHASVLSGLPGFAEAVDVSTISLHPSAGDGATVSRDLGDTDSIGLLAIDFATRRRMRVNGTGHAQAGEIRITTREVYANCPQYIHPRENVALPATKLSSSASLTAAQIAHVTAADTFFIASWHPERGADASHRGGPAGFVSATAHSVSWPDYSGNNMFNTFGNLLVHDRCSLLFADFVTGLALRIDGRASIEWGPERRVTVAIDEVVSFSG